MIPVELCVVPTHRRNSLLSPQMTASMIRVAAVKPDQRLRGAQEAHRIANFSSDDFARAYGLDVEPKPVEVTGRILNTPKVQYGNNRVSQPSNGAWQAKGAPALTPGEKIETWAVVAFVDERDAPNEAIQRFVETLTRTGRDLGLVFTNQNPIVQRCRPNPTTALSELER